TKRNTVYYNLINLINKGTNKEEIVSKTLELTNNEEFFKILESNLYGMSYAKAVLLRLENSIQDDSVFKSYSGLISIEHILPQKATETYWTERFSNQQINENVHRIGNLVLLSGRKNSQAQNYNFDKKKDVYLKNSEKVSFDLTKEICEKSEWNLDNFNKRQNQMIENSRKLWEIK
ncbi:HNH endonuclease, partial [Flavobacterium psychrophilum]